MANKIVTIDPGKFATKAIAGNDTKGQRVIFRTKLLKLNDNVGLDIQGNSFKVEYRGDTYILGDQGEEVDYSVNKTSINHKLASYVAISQLTDSSDEVIDLVLGCPTNIYKNEKLREEYRKYLTNNSEPIEIVVNGNYRRFTIESALVLPEGSGIVFLDPSRFKNNRVAVADLGGLNMNFSVYNDMVPEVSSMLTLNKGSYELENSLEKELSTIYGSSLSAGDIQQFIKQGGVRVKGKLDADSVRTIDSQLERYLRGIVQEVKKNNFNLDLMDVVFVGGTSKAIEKQIVRYLPHATIPSNSQWTNVLGFHKFGVLKYAQSRE